MTPKSAPESATLRRRVAAVVYDAIAAIAVVYFACFVPVVLAGGALAPENPFLFVYMIGTAFGYFGVCWTRGRTLGMQAWKLALRCDDGAARLTWRASAVRFATAAVSFGAAGLGYLWALLDPERRTWHDRLSHSRVVHLPRAGSA